jgi:hypothetical protein
MMPPYQVRAVHDRFGRVVGFLDGHFVLDGYRRVVAEVRFGTVLRFDGRICGEYDGLHFFDRERALVATTITTIADAPVRQSRDAIFHLADFDSSSAGESLAVLTDAPSRSEWSRLDWHRYVEV